MPKSMLTNRITRSGLQRLDPRAGRSRGLRSAPVRRPLFLVPVSYSRSSQAAVRLAVDLARPVEGKIVVLRVLPIQTHAMSGYVADDRDRIERETDRLQAFVDRLLSEARADSDYELAIAFDTAPHRKIAELAADYGAALIVMGARGSSIRRFLFGGVAERTRQRADCPVVTIGAGAVRRFTPGGPPGSP